MSSWRRLEIAIGGSEGGQRHPGGGDVKGNPGGDQVFHGGDAAGVARRHTADADAVTRVERVSQVGRG